MHSYILNAVLAIVIIPMTFAYVLSSRSDRPRRTMFGLSILFSTIALLLLIATFMSCHLFGYAYVQTALTVKTCTLFPVLRTL